MKKKAKTKQNILQKKHTVKKSFFSRLFWLYDDLFCLREGRMWVNMEVINKKTTGTVQKITDLQVIKKHLWDQI